MGFPPKCLVSIVRFNRLGRSRYALLSYIFRVTSTLCIIFAKIFQPEGKPKWPDSFSYNFSVFSRKCVQGDRLILISAGMGTEWP